MGNKIISIGFVIIIAPKLTDGMLPSVFDSITAQVNLHRDFLKYSALAAAKPEAASLLEL